ncbi:DNA-directed RNA polymerase III subunit RPC7-like [Parasteatoda tepidariorum]|nr:DNA-directed RNA polymerase III subunit RPC7-like [Parasteatoda tepidariorum]
MAGRGRGRFRGSFPAQDACPVSQPPPTYPPLQFKPVPLLTGKKIDYLVTLKQEIRSSFRESGYFIPPVSVKKDIERYTDKYQPIHAADQIVWDKSLFPRELFEKPKKKRKIVKKPIVKKETAVVEKLQALEEKENTLDPDEEEEEGAENVEEYEDEEMEEENDYATSYFDNGENYLDDEDDNLDDGYE